MGMGNAMMSRAKRPVVNMTMGILTGGANAVASLRKGFSIRTPLKNTVRVSFVKCGAIAIGTDDRPVDIALGRSSRRLSRIMMMNCNSRGGIGMANSIDVISSGMVRSHPMRGMSRTLRNIIPKLGVSMNGDNNTLSDDLDVGVHNTNAVNRNSDKDPLMLVSNVRNSVGAIGPGSVRGVSMLGSTTSSSVCNTHTSFNMVVVAAGDNGSNGAHIGCSNGMHFSSTVRVPRVISSCAFTRCFGHTGAGSKKNLMFSRTTLRHVGGCRAKGCASPGAPRCCKTGTNGSKG